MSVNNVESKEAMAELAQAGQHLTFRFGHGQDRGKVVILLNADRILSGRDLASL